MTEGWAYGGAPQTGAESDPREPPGTVTLVEGTTFCICGRSGDIRPGAEQGLFYRDTRFVSRFELTVDGQPAQPLTVQRTSPYSATFVTRRPPQRGIADSTLLIVRRRYVGNGLLEQVSVQNVSREAATVELAITVDTDFAGLFDVKEGRAQSREGIERSGDGRLRMRYRRGADSREVTVTADGDPVVHPGGLAWHLVVAGRSKVVVSVYVAPMLGGVEPPPHYALGEPPEHSRPATQLAAWRRGAPAVTTPHARLERLLTTSAEDLGVLRVFDPEHPDRVVVAAGAPWFMTLFGRDALLTSWMLLPLDTSVALGTLQSLSETQGTDLDPLSEEEPGRILHEIRSGLDAEAALGGRNLYYGSIDATPLFVILLGELRRWGLARAVVEALLPHADRALEWVERFGDRDGDGFVEYQRKTERGLANQGWKDSCDSISFADGTLAEPPIALAEVQGYVYAAYLARAHFAREAGDEDVAERWTQRARTLKRRFNEAFWLPDRGYYALALDCDKRPVDALASNMGHCLWTGIVDEDKAPQVAAHLMSSQMFTGFGVRTLATSMGAYNPVSYHNGSVWPHDNAIIAAGLSRYGFVAETQRIALGLIDAADRLGGRLPELFCGFDRDEYHSPVPYPTSCSPQAWAAAAPLLLVRSLLRFDPWVPFGRVWCDPAVPAQLLPMSIAGVHLAGASVRLDIDAQGWRLSGLPEGMELIRSPRQPLTATTPPLLTSEVENLLTEL